MAQNVAKILTVDLWRHSKHKRHWMRSGGLRPPKHTRVLANAKTLASSPAARARLSPAPLARPAAGPYGREVPCVRPSAPVPRTWARLLALAGPHGRFAAARSPKPLHRPYVSLSTYYIVKTVFAQNFTIVSF